MKKFLFLALNLTFFSLNISAGIKFNQGDINPEDEILFTVEQDFPGTEKYSTLIETSVKNSSSMKVLTAFPEQMEMLSGGKILQVRNRYGTSRIDLSSGSFSWKNCCDSIPQNSNRLSPYAVSPDGQWFLYVQKINSAGGFLIAENVKTGKWKTIDASANFSYDRVPVKWSPDSSIFVYEKNGAVYFCNPDGFLKGLEITESFRKIGEGNINSVNFAGDKNLIYIDGDLVYKIGVKEMYTLGLYSEIIGKGTAIGRLPDKFDCERDIFSCNEFLTGIFVIKNEKIFTSYKINSPLCEYLDVEYSGPFADSKSSVLDTGIFWSDYTVPVVWIRLLPYSGEKVISQAYTVTNRLQKIIEVSDSGLPYVSPDGSKVAFYSADKVYVYETSGWKKLGEISGERIVSMLWKDNSNIFIGGEKTIRHWNMNTKEVSLVFLSSSENGYFLDSGDIVSEAAEGTAYVLNRETGSWKIKSDAVNHQNVTNNGRYRLFAGSTPNPVFENALYVRTLTGKPVTTAVFEKSVTKQKPAKEAALIFDAYDSVDGLSKILYALDKYKVTGTFFMNGEFIRRYPNETRQISNSSNECGSMFFTVSDLTSKDFIINEEFIRRGLARNEDEFFQCTKKEISLLWHAPDYKDSSEIIQYGKNAGYTYVSTSVKDSDKVTLEDAIFQGKKYVSPAKFIDEVMETLKTNNGGTVPVTVGISKGIRKEYVYDFMPLLLSAIIDSGYRIVPVKNLQDNLLAGKK